MAVEEENQRLNEEVTYLRKALEIQLSRHAQTAEELVAAHRQLEGGDGPPPSVAEDTTNSAAAAASVAEGGDQSERARATAAVRLLRTRETEELALLGLVRQSLADERWKLSRVRACVAALWLQIQTAAEEVALIHPPSPPTPAGRERRGGGGGLLWDSGGLRTRRARRLEQQRRRRDMLLKDAKSLQERVDSLADQVAKWSIASSAAVAAASAPPLPVLSAPSTPAASRTTPRQSPPAGHYSATVATFAPAAAAAAAAAAIETGLSRDQAVAGLSKDLEALRDELWRVSCRLEGAQLSVAVLETLTRTRLPAWPGDPDGSDDGSGGGGGGRNTTYSGEVTSGGGVAGDASDVAGWEGRFTAIALLAEGTGGAARRSDETPTEFLGRLRLRAAMAARLEERHAADVEELHEALSQVVLNTRDIYKKRRSAEAQLQRCETDERRQQNDSVRRLLERRDEALWRKDDLCREQQRRVQQLEREEHRRRDKENKEARQAAAAPKGSSPRAAAASNTQSAVVATQPLAALTLPHPAAAPEETEGADRRRRQQRRRQSRSDGALVAAAALEPGATWPAPRLQLPASETTTNSAVRAPASVGTHKYLRRTERRAAGSGSGSGSGSGRRPSRESGLQIASIFDSGVPAAAVSWRVSPLLPSWAVRTSEATQQHLQSVRRKFEHVRSCQRLDRGTGVARDANGISLGRLDVTVLSASGLPMSRTLGRACDAFVAVTVEPPHALGIPAGEASDLGDSAALLAGSSMRRRTRVAWGTQLPKWEERLEIAPLVSLSKASVVFRMFHFSRFGQHVLLGQSHVPLSAFLNQRLHSGSVPLAPGDGSLFRPSNAAGNGRFELKVKLRLVYHPEKLLAEMLNALGDMAREHGSVGNGSDSGGAETDEEVLARNELLFTSGGPDDGGGGRVRIVPLAAPPSDSSDETLALERANVLTGMPASSAAAAGIGAAADVDLLAMDAVAPSPVEAFAGGLNAARTGASDAAAASGAAAGFALEAAALDQGAEAMAAAEPSPISPALSGVQWQHGGNDDQDADISPVGPQVLPPPTVPAMELSATTVPAAVRLDWSHDGLGGGRASSPNWAIFRGIRRQSQPARDADGRSSQHLQARLQPRSGWEKI